MFHATESTYNTSYLQPTYSKQLFGSQKFLWLRKETQPTDNITANVDITIPFIIQMPMVQFPPSANIVSKDEGLSYHMNFTLTAYLDQSSGENILKTSKPIIYMPFIETNISKKPMIITTSSNTSTSDVNTAQPSISVNIHSLDYIPGENIPLSLTFQNILKKSVESITIKLMEVRTWNKISPSYKGKGCKNGKKLKQQVIQKSIPFATTPNTESSSEFINCPFNLSIDIPSETLPSFTYGAVFSLSYVLKISVKRKGKLMSHNYELTDIPITIGTLGYGIKTSQEIKVYSIFKGVFDDDNVAHNNSDNQPVSEGSSSATLPVPKFLDAIEYEDSLPVYIEEKLPAYDTVIKLSPPNCIM